MRELNLTKTQLKQIERFLPSAAESTDISFEVDNSGFYPNVKNRGFLVMKYVIGNESYRAKIKTTLTKYQLSITN